MLEKTLSTLVGEINETLRSYGKEAVQEIKMTGQDGQIIGKVRYGYRPQYVFDAVNAILLPQNWKHEIVSKDIFNQQAVVEVKLYIRIGDDWLCKGSQMGQMQIVKQNVGDAYKGAITDALQKCFSLLSIGTDSYRGLLEAVYKGVSQPSPSTRPPVRTTETASPPKENDPAIPQITGVHIQRVDDRFIAKGKVYDKKEMLKAAGFKWDGAQKTWFKEAVGAVQ